MLCLATHLQAPSAFTMRISCIDPYLKLPQGVMPALMMPTLVTHQPPMSTHLCTPVRGGGGVLPPGGPTHDTTLLNRRAPLLRA